MMAAQSLIGTFRRIMPDLLRKKDRGRLTEAAVMIQSSKYGEIKATEFIPGAEVLYDQDAESIEEANNNDEEDEEWIDINSNSEEEINEDESASDTDKRTKVSSSSSSEDDEDEEDEDSEDSENNEDSEDKELTLLSNENKNVENTCEANSGEREADKVSRKKNVLTKQQKKAQKLERKAKQKVEKKEELITERKTKASVISTERLLTDKDFRKIDVALAKQEITHAKRSLKRTHDKIEKDQGGELVKLSDIENIYKKRKHDKTARQESVKKGQEGRDKFGFKNRRKNPLCSKTNREKRKGKAFQMMKQKFKAKVKRSFREKQIALKNHLIKQKRMK